MRDQGQLAFWYRLAGVQTGWVQQETDPTWSVADRSGQPVGSVSWSRSGMLQQVTYWLLDATGAAVVGFAEPHSMKEALSANSLPILGVDGQPTGAFAEPHVLWGGAPIGKFLVQETHEPHTFSGAWMWNTADEVVATVTQTRSDAGAYFQLDRPEGLEEPLATATLALPLLVHRTLLRGTEQDIHRRGRRQELGRPGWGEVSDLL
jgi:hypothetical protein